MQWSLPCKLSVHGKIVMLSDLEICLLLILVKICSTYINTQCKVFPRLLRVKEVVELTFHNYELVKLSHAY